MFARPQLAALYRPAQLCLLAEEYCDAAATLHAAPATPGTAGSRPWFQLIGHALELSLKACIASSGQTFPESHNLSLLVERAESLGFTLCEEHAHALIIHVEHQFFRNLGTDEKFPARYGDSTGYNIPPHARLEAIVRGLVAQARARHTRALNATMTASEPPR